LTAERVQTLRYGENPHQQGAWYYFKGAQQPFSQVQGQKELSYNNIWDMEAAWGIPKEFVSLCNRNLNFMDSPGGNLPILLQF